MKAAAARNLLIDMKYTKYRFLFMDIVTKATHGEDKLIYTKATFRYLTGNNSQGAEKKAMEYLMEKGFTLEMDPHKQQIIIKW